MAEPEIFTPPFDVEQICRIIPHRYPFLLIDRLEDIIEDKIVIGYKNVTVNEPFFQGHFPGNPIMPGVLVLEAMAQLGAVYILSKPENRGRTPYFMSIEYAKFRRPVVPGDRLDIKLTILKIRSSAGRMHGLASVKDQVAAEAELSFAFAPGNI